MKPIPFSRGRRPCSGGRRHLVAAAASLLAASLLAEAALPLAARSATAADRAPGAAAGGQAKAALASDATGRTLLIVGDSLSAEYGLPRGTGWVALLERRLADEAPGWTIVNASVSGETTAGGASRIAGLLQRHRPAAVIVELGANDALRGLDLDATRRNLERIVAAARAADARVLLLGMQIPPNYGRAYTEAFSRLFVDVAHKHQVPLVPFFLEGVAARAELFQRDRIHPNREAQPIMLDAVWPSLEQVLAGAS